MSKPDFEAWAKKILLSAEAARRGSCNACPLSAKLSGGGNPHEKTISINPLHRSVRNVRRI